MADPELRRADISERLGKQLASRADRQALIDKKILKDPDSIAFRGETLMVKLAHRRNPSALAKLNVIKEFDADPEQSSDIGAAKASLDKKLKKDKLNEFIGRKASHESELRKRIIVDEAETMAADDIKSSREEFGSLPMPTVKRISAPDSKVWTPQQILEEVKCDAVGCGWAHSIARDASGKLYACGTGQNGRLGSGDTIDSPIFKEVHGIQGVSSFSVADNHNIAVSHGKVFTWGDGAWSKLGHGSVEDKLTPTQVTALDDAQISSVAAGGYHSLALSATGHVYSWGWGKNGRLGVNFNFDVDASIPSESELVQDSPKRIPFPEGLQIAKVSAGQSCSAAISTNGELYVWGSGRWGCLGLGSEEDRLVPAKVESLKDEVVTNVSVGDAHMIVSTKSNKIFTWGRNDYGQLGRSDAKQDGTPGIVSFVEGVVSEVAAGKSHTLAIVGGKVYSWGNNAAGQLGVGNAEKQYKAPQHVSIPNASETLTISAGWSHTVVVLKDGSVYGFGSNLKTQLGFPNK